ncbi:uncharacterized protein LOC113979381, partial [Neopelma chrysocephalum]|uniref:uncharacterized protein LOC113979381 n=1 Tax=Neopelma chrysocephalum TaxID=114329 RepID=UPI000FCD484F
GGDNLVVVTHGDIIVEGTEEPGVTNDPGDTWGHLNEVHEDATTEVGLVTTSPGSDKMMVATDSDVIEEGTDKPSVTNDSGDTWGHLNEVHEGATTPVGPVTTSPGGDKVLVAHGGDVVMEGTNQPGVTSDPSDPKGHLNEVHEGATTPVGLVTPPQGGDNLVVVTHGDVTVERIEEPGVTSDPRDTLGHINEVHEGATTPVGLVTTSPGGDKVLVATGSDIIEEGTPEPGVTNDPRDTLGHVNEVYGDATTPVAPVTVSSTGDKLLVAAPGDVTEEGTDQPSVTGDPKDTEGHLNEVPEGATTPVGLVTTSPGSDKVLVATGRDVIVEGTNQPSVTGDPKDTLGHVNEVYGDATTPVGLVTTSPG